MATGRGSCQLQWQATVPVGKGHGAGGQIGIELRGVSEPEVGECAVRGAAHEALIGDHNGGQLVIAPLGDLVAACLPATATVDEALCGKHSQCQRGASDQEC